MSFSKRRKSRLGTDKFQWHCRYPFFLFSFHHSFIAFTFENNQNQILAGYCNKGYGGSPFRKCLDTNGTVGKFDEIQSPCVQCLLFLFLLLFFFFLTIIVFFFFFFFFFFKVPEPVSEIQVIAKPNLAVISWGIPERANYYKVRLVIQDMLAPINHGAGLNVTTNKVILREVIFFWISNYSHN